MYSKLFASSALVALTSVTSVLAGSATVVNQCSYDVYLWSVADVYDVPMHTLSAGSNSYSESYRTNADGGGISIKLSHTQQQSQICQFEYTLGGENLIFYDLSNIDGSPFQADGMTLSPSDSSCPSVDCEAGQVCTGAYINPDDNEATHGCQQGTDLVLTLCPGGSGGSAPASSAPASTAEPTSAPAPTTTLATSTVASSSAVATPSVVTVEWTRPAAPEKRSVHHRRHGHGHPHLRR